LCVCVISSRRNSKGITHQGKVFLKYCTESWVFLFLNIWNIFSIVFFTNAFVIWRHYRWIYTARRNLKR
jgi:hypothetical protein